MNMSDPITGDWDATMTSPTELEELTLVLMLEGTKVSGRIESPQGVHVLEEGAFKKDQLTLTYPSDQGETEISAQLHDGKLVGEYNIADKERGEWQATKR